MYKLFAFFVFLAGGARCHWRCVHGQLPSEPPPCTQGMGGEQTAAAAAAAAAAAVAAAEANLFSSSSSSCAKQEQLFSSSGSCGYQLNHHPAHIASKMSLNSSSSSSLSGGYSCLISSLWKTLFAACAARLPRPELDGAFSALRWRRLLCEGCCCVCLCCCMLSLAGPAGCTHLKCQKLFAQSLHGPMFELCKPPLWQLLLMLFEMLFVVFWCLQDLLDATFDVRAVPLWLSSLLTVLFVVSTVGTAMLCY
jgi:hypothetical protein